MTKKIAPEWGELREQLCALVMSADVENQTPKIFRDWLAGNAPSPEERVLVVSALIAAQRRRCQSWPNRRRLCMDGILMAEDLLTFVLRPEAGTMRHPTNLRDLLLDEGLEYLPATLTTVRR